MSKYLYKCIRTVAVSCDFCGLIAKNEKDICTSRVAILGRARCYNMCHACYKRVYVDGKNAVSECMICGARSNASLRVEARTLNIPIALATACTLSHLDEVVRIMKDNTATVGECKEHGLVAQTLIISSTEYTSGIWALLGYSNTHTTYRVIVL
jgi:hypothetical protein